MIYTDCITCGAGIVADEPNACMMCGRPLCEHCYDASSYCKDCQKDEQPIHSNELPSWALPAPELRIGQTVHIAMNAPEYQTGQICDIDPSRPNGDIFAVALDGITFEDGSNINYYWKEHIQVIDTDPSHYMKPHIPGRGYEVEEPLLTACPWCGNGTYHNAEDIDACPLKSKREL